MIESSSKAVVKPISPVEFQTYGCKVNTYDTGLLQMRIQDSSLEQIDFERKIHIINTCAVTAEATREAVRHIRRIKKRDSQAFVVATGCAAQVDTSIFSDLAEVDLVVGNSHKGDIARLIKESLLSKSAQKVYRNNIFRKSDVEAGGGRELHHSRAFLKIQDGCNSFCSYCVIPYARGRSRSVSVVEVIDRVHRLENEGCLEVVLTGIHIADYLDETSGSDLVQLIKKVLRTTSIGRIRLGSLEPRELTAELLELFADPRLCPHFHMSIQSANSRVLQAMLRQYDACDVEQALELIHDRWPHAFVGMDVIVGFPGETEEEFQETIERLRSLPWTRIHVFPYSIRPGTKAANIATHIGAAKIRERAELLREISTERFTLAALEQVGKSKEALIWSDRHGGLKGLTRDYWNVVIDLPDHSERAPLTGKELQVDLTGFDHSQASRLDGLHHARLRK